jgi:hypothetical protein
MRRLAAVPCARRTVMAGRLLALAASRARPAAAAMRGCGRAVAGCAGSSLAIAAPEQMLECGEMAGGAAPLDAGAAWRRRKSNRVSARRARQRKAMDLAALQQLVRRAQALPCSLLPDAPACSLMPPACSLMRGVAARPSASRPGHAWPQARAAPGGSGGTPCRARCSRLCAPHQAAPASGAAGVPMRSACNQHRIYHTLTRSPRKSRSRAAPRRWPRWPRRAGSCASAWPT